MANSTISRNRFPGVEYTISQGNTGTFGPHQKILYLFVDYTVDGTGTITFADYGAGSGLYAIGDGIDQFISDRVNGVPLPAAPTLLYAIDAGDMPVINSATYVVFAIANSSFASFRLNPNAVTTNDGVSGQTNTPDYFNLIHVLSTGDYYSNPSPSPAPTTPCYLVFFQAMFTPGTHYSTDSFNLWVNVEGRSPQPIDPAIKNKGHPPPPPSISPK
jgi:hypothetical protein